MIVKSLRLLPKGAPLNALFHIERITVNAGNAIPILNQSAIFVCRKPRRMPGSLSASSTYQQYASLPSPSRLNIIFDLEMDRRSADRSLT